MNQPLTVTLARRAGGRVTAIALGAAFATLLAMPLLHLLPADSALHLSAYSLTLTGKILCYAIVALALDLVWGYAGLLSLGHGLFFALGGYAMGMYLMRQASGDSLPAFMTFLSWNELPWYWAGTQHFLWALCLVVLVPGALAFAFGYFAFRSRIRGVYFSIMTQALTFAGMLLFFRNETGFGGNNGFTDFRSILGFPITAPGTRAALFLATVALLAASLLLGWRLARSKFGRVLTALRDAENRLMFCGYDPRGYKLFVWTLSAVLCGLAGALFVPQVGIINPSDVADQLHRGRRLGRPRRTRHPARPAARRRRGERREELVHRGLPGILAVLPRRAVHRRHPVPAARPARPAAQGEGAMRTTPHLMLEPAFHPGLDTAGSGRDAIGLGAATSGRLDARHGTILSLEDINVSFDGFKALRDLTLYIGVGELRCIIGPNGAGKTTLMDVITGKTRPQSGTAYFGDTLDLTRMSEVQIAQAGIGRKFQKPTVFEALSVFENLELAQRADKSVWASLRARLDGTQRERIEEVLATIRLLESRQRPAGLLSHGQKQFLEIGMLLVQEPQLLLLDEPVAGMTDAETEFTAELFKSLARKHSLMVVEHDMGFVGSIADHVTVLHQGHVLAEGSLAEVQADEQVIEVYLGR